MKFINRARQTGKTTMLINTAHATGYPIVVYDEARVRCVLDQARKMGINDIKVFSLSSYSKEFMHDRGHDLRRILIDEAETIINKALDEYFHSEVIACTFSIPYENFPKENTKEEADNGRQ